MELREKKKTPLAKQAQSLKSHRSHCRRRPTSIATGRPLCRRRVLLRPSAPAGRARRATREAVPQHQGLHLIPHPRTDILGSQIETRASWCGRERERERREPAVLRRAATSAALLPASTLDCSPTTPTYSDSDRRFSLDSIKRRANEFNRATPSSSSPSPSPVMLPNRDPGRRRSQAGDEDP